MNQLPFFLTSFDDSASFSLIRNNLFANYSIIIFINIFLTYSPI